MFRKTQVNVVSQLLTIVAILTVQAVPAQLTGEGQLPAKSTVVPIPGDASAPLFLPAVTYGSGGNGAHSIAAVDLNGDGELDLAVTNSDSNSVGILLGIGDGTFQPAVTYGSGGDFPSSLSEADVNGDGKPDLVVAGYNSSTVGVLLGNGDGTFQTVVTYGSGGYFAWSATVADVNGDGKPDLIVTNQCASSSNCVNSTVGVLLGNGDGTFQAVMTYDSGGNQALSVAVGDVTTDGKPDLVVANWGSTNVGVLLGNGDGTFRAAVTYDSGGLVESVALTDLNGDGKLDVVVANECASTCATTGVGVLLSNGDGTFRAVVTYGAGGKNSATSVVVADVNGDNKPDVLVADICAGNDCSDGAVGVLLGNGDGTFQAAAVYSSGGYAAHWVSVGDVNADGRPDLLVANCGPSSCANGVVGVLVNNIPFDRTPPVITLSVTGKILRSAQGKIVQISLSGMITDSGSGIDVNSAAFTVNNEDKEIEQRGPITLGSGGKYSFTVLLRVSRRGSHSDGPRYIVTVRARDNAGNRGSKTRVVSLPHDHGNGDD